MHLWKVVVTKDKAYDLVEALEMLNEVDFINLNRDEQPHKLPYSKEVSKANELCTKLDYIVAECK